MAFYSQHTGAQVDEAVDKALATKWTRVYTNDSPSTDFATGNIGIANISDYDYLVVCFRSHKSLATVETRILPLVDATTYGVFEPCWVGATAPVVGYRTLTVNIANNRLEVGQGYYRTMSSTTTSSSDGYIVPTAVFAVKN